MTRRKFYIPCVVELVYLLTYIVYKVFLLFMCVFLPYWLFFPRIRYIFDQFPKKSNKKHNVIINIVFSLCIFFFTFCFRFYTGDNIWSAQVNITKCRIKSATDDAARGGTSDGGGRGRSRSGGRGGSSAPIDYDSCPLQISVSPRRPPDVLDPKTRYLW